MRGLWVVTMMLGSLMALGAQEHPGKPVEHPGKSAAKVTAEDIRKGMQAYIAKDTQLKGGYFLIWDGQAKRPRVLQLVRVHDKLNKLTAADYERIFKAKAPTAEVYFACCDFREVGGKATLDLDFFMQATPAGIEPFRIVIHKENGKPRLQYPPEK
jgi:hypothetical protein